MNLFHGIRLGVFVIGIAAMLAVLGPWPSPSSAATVQVSLRVNPGAAGSSGTLLCVWHGACITPPTPGDGLDWRAFGGTTVYWRSWGFRSDTSSYATIGNAAVSQYNTSCYNVRARFTDSNSTPRGDIHYTHTNQSGSTWFYVPGTSNNYNFTTGVASVASSEINGSCVNRGGGLEDLWSAAHLHQRSPSPFSQVGHNSTGSYSTTGINDSQAYQLWFWN